MEVEVEVEVEVKVAACWPASLMRISCRCNYAAPAAAAAATQLCLDWVIKAPRSIFHVAHKTLTGDTDNGAETMFWRKKHKGDGDEETKEKKDIYTFEELTNFPMVFYKTIGEDLYSERDKNLFRRYLLRTYLVLGFLNFNAYVVGEIAYFIVHITSTTTLLEATAVAPCIGFSFMSDFKQFGLTVNRKVLVKLLDDLKEIFPKTKEQQEAYDVAYYKKHMTRVMWLFTILCMTYTSSFSFYPAVKSTIKYYFMGSEIFERNYGFHILFPYDAETDITVYWFSYWGLAHCAYVAGVSYVCVDLLLITTITQLTMHFNYIADTLAAYDGDEHTEEENYKYAQNLVVYHARLLE